MGFGMYTSADWQKLKKSRGVDTSGSEKDLFKMTECDPRFDPKFIAKRESRDSADHPDSVPIIIGLDVTGSMGYLSYNIAKTSLHETMMKLFSTGAVKDPQVMFAAYGDYRDQAPLQVTQFESDIRIAEQLMSLWLENRGSGDVTPQLLWHFAESRTSTDCFEKRRKKGFLFTIGDQAELRFLTDGSLFERVFQEEIGDFKTDSILRKVKNKYEVFHIILCKYNNSIPVSFASLLPGHIMALSSDNIDCIPEIIISTIQLVNGEKESKVIEQWDTLKQPIVKEALKTLVLPKKGILSF